MRVWGAKARFDFKPKTHVELCESLKLVDFARGAKLSGSGFLLYTGWGARLERALIQFLLDLHIGEHGYTEVSPPFLVEPRLHGRAWGSSPSSPINTTPCRKGRTPRPWANCFSFRRRRRRWPTFIARRFCRKAGCRIYYCAYTPCFRGEAGAAGVGTRGMIRVHQFDKVELIKITRPEDGYAELEKLVANAERVLQLLGLHYRVVQLCTGDMGFASALTYDIEVWAPGQGQYLEVSSCSNCEDFQARRMNLRFKTAERRKQVPAHPQRQRHGPGPALRRLGGDLSAGRWQSSFCPRCCGPG